MNSKRVGLMRDLRCTSVTLILAALFTLLGCGDNATSSGSTPSGGSGGASNGGGANEGGTAGTPAGGAGTGGNYAPTGGGGGEAGGASACTHPSHVLPRNPSNPPDGITLSGFYVDSDAQNAAHY